MMKRLELEMVFFLFLSWIQLSACVSPKCCRNSGIPLNPTEKKPSEAAPMPGSVQSQGLEQPGLVEMGQNEI